MKSISELAMRDYLSKSISSLNQNKLNGLLAEIDFRNHLNSLGFGDRISVGGWIARTDGLGNFGRNTVVFFPETMCSEKDYSIGCDPVQPPDGLHTICSTFHQIGIHSYFLSPGVQVNNDPLSIIWRAKQLGIPGRSPWVDFPSAINGFRERTRKHNFLRYHSNVSEVPQSALAEEFSKENARVSFQNRFTSEMSDIDGIFWGNQYTYPIEIKEKTSAADKKMGDFFGLDLGPFVKLAFFAAKRGNLHSIFIVKEIDDRTSRNLVDWWYIKFDDLAQFASWNPLAGGKRMTGGSSTTVKIPKDQFKKLDRVAIQAL